MPATRSAYFSSIPAPGCRKMSATRREETLHAQGLLCTLFRACKRSTQARTALYSPRGTCRVLLLLQPSWVKGCCSPNHSMCCHLSGKNHPQQGTCPGCLPRAFPVVLSWGSEEREDLSRASTARDLCGAGELLSLQQRALLC